MGLQSSNNRLIIVTHNDLDGVGAAAAYLRIVGLRPSEATVIFAEPYNVDEIVERLQGYLEDRTTIAFMDIGFNRSSTPRAIELLRGSGAKELNVEWYDHHVWQPDDVKLVQSIGSKVFIDRSTCGAGVVIRYASKLYGRSVDEFLERLESAVCAADLWRWDDPLAPKLFRASTSPPNMHNSAWKQLLIEKFYSGILWDDDLQARLKEYLREEFMRSSSELRGVAVARAGSCSAAAVVRKYDLPSDSILGSMLVSRTNAQLSAMVKRRGFRRVSISLRSRGGADVQVIAKSLGGGGHPRAAGAAMNLPLLVALVGLISKRYIASYVARKLSQYGNELGACRPNEETTKGSQGEM
mgnify:CR=1